MGSVDIKLRMPAWESLALRGGKNVDDITAAEATAVVQDDLGLNQARFPGQIKPRAVGVGSHQMGLPRNETFVDGQDAEGGFHGSCE